MQDVSVDSDFVDFLRKIQKRRPLVVKHGITLRHDDLRKGDVPVVLDTDDPVTILFEFVKTKNLRLIDFLKNLDKDNSETLSRDELRRGLEVKHSLQIVLTFHQTIPCFNHHTEETFLKHCVKRSKCWL